MQYPDGLWYKFSLLVGVDFSPLMNLPNIQWYTLALTIVQEED